LHDRRCNLTGQKDRDNVLAPRVVPHFDNHSLADRPMFMDDNARTHRARIVQHFLQQEAVQSIPRPAMSTDMNPIEHVWDFIGRKINQRNPKCQNPVRLPSRTYKSNLQSKEKQPQTVTPPPSKAVVPKMWLS
jgi:transposase